MDGPAPIAALATTAGWILGLVGGQWVNVLGALLTAGLLLALVLWDRRRRPVAPRANDPLPVAAVPRPGRPSAALADPKPEPSPTSVRGRRRLADGEWSPLPAHDIQQRDPAVFDLQLEVAEPPRGFEPLPGPHAQDGPTRTDHTADEQGEDAAQRAARRLHTELGQTLAALRWEIDLLDAQADPAAPEDCARALGLVDRAMTELRSLVDDLHPPELDDLGLVAAVRGLVLRARRRTPIRLELTIRDEDRLEQIDADMALGVFRLVQDALDGVIRLAAAQAVHIGIEIDPVDGLVLLFRNIGSRHGRPDAQVPDPLPAVERLQRRAARLDGVVELTSATAGETLILLKLPLVLRANVVAEQDDHPVVKNATGELR